MARGASPSSKRTRSSLDKSRKIRLQDIAELTGVGIATVDRVLNERGNVAPQTAEKVLAVARRLKLKRILPASHRRLLRIQVILARLELPLIGRMNREFAKLAERVDRSIVIQRTILKSEAPALLAEQIRSTKYDAVIVYAQEHDAIHAAVEEVFQAAHRLLHDLEAHGHPRDREEEAEKARRRNAERFGQREPA